MAEKEKVTLVVFSGELDKALASFNIATTAASMGMDVTMFFTFWGLNVIKKNEGRLKSKGWMRKMLNWMNRGGSKRLPLGRFHVFGLGTWMAKKLMGEVRMPTLEDMIATAKRLGVSSWPAIPLWGSWAWRRTLSSRRWTVLLEQLPSWVRLAKAQSICSST